MFPMEQVITDRVSPMHRSPKGVKGVVLIKVVIPTPKVYQAIGVIEPALGSHEVITLSTGRFGYAGSSAPYLFSLLFGSSLW